MELKPCPHCGKELPAELSFCPYCMTKLTEEQSFSVPVRRKKIPARGLVFIAATLCVMLVLGVILFPLRNGMPQDAITAENPNPESTLDPSTATLPSSLDTVSDTAPTPESSADTDDNSSENDSWFGGFFSQLFGGSDDSKESSSVPVTADNQPSSTISSSAPGSSSNTTTSKPTSSSSGTTTSSNTTTSKPTSSKPTVPSSNTTTSSPTSSKPTTPSSNTTTSSPTSSKPTTPSSNTTTSSPTSSFGGNADEYAGTNFAASCEAFEPYITRWNQTAIALSWNQYVIRDYTPQYETFDYPVGYTLRLTDITMAGENKVDSMDWVRYDGSTKIDPFHMIRVYYNQSVSWEEHKKLNYLTLVVFSGYRDDSFIDTFYSDSGWERRKIQGGSSNQVGWVYGKGVLYHDWLYGDEYYIFFEEYLGEGGHDSTFEWYPVFEMWQQY